MKYDKAKFLDKFGLMLVTKVSISSMTVYGYTLLDSAGAHCPEACVEPHGGVHASCLFTQQAKLLNTTIWGKSWIKKHYQCFRI